MTKTRLGSAESFTTEWEPNARHALHAQIIIETLIEELKIEVTDDAIAKELEQVAEEEDLDLEELKKYYAKGSKKEYLENGIKETLLFEELLAKNVIKPGEKMTFHELLKLDD